MPLQKILNGQGSLEKEEQIEVFTLPDCKLYYKAIGIKSMVFAKKKKKKKKKGRGRERQTYRSTEQNREARNKLMHICSFN